MRTDSEKMQGVYQKIKTNEADKYTNSMLESYSVDLNKEMTRDFCLDVKGAAQTESLQRLSGLVTKSFQAIHDAVRLL